MDKETSTPIVEALAKMTPEAKKAFLDNLFRDNHFFG